MAGRIEVPVLVVGAGPSGLAAALLLAQQGVANLVVERRDGAQAAPAAHVVNARTFEILRAAGVDMKAVAAACQPPADGGRVYWAESLTGELLGSLPFEQQGEDQLAFTPTPLRNLSQDDFERILLARVGELENVQLRHRHEWIACEQDAAGVTSRVRDLASGEEIEVRSRWLLAADGAGSRVRKAFGIEAVGPPRIASFVMIHLEASWRALVADRPGALYFLHGPRARGTLVAHDQGAKWVYMHPWDPDAEPAEAYDVARCAEIVREAVGGEAPPFRVRTIATWHMSVQVASHYRERRGFLVGDSAHRFPPTGGLGLNTGVQDAHNLAWKLATVERGWAADALLDSYESERKPIAQANADASARNALKLAQVAQALGPRFDGERTAVRAAIANQAEHFDMLGLQLGFRYERGALVADGTPPPAVANAVREYTPSGRPGARVPHAWTQRAGERVSTLDLLPLDRFTLIAGRRGEAWLDAARGVSPQLATLAIGRDVADEAGAWARALGIADDGALLVRPDQHVAWRSASGAVSPANTLREVLGTLLGL